MGEVTDRLKGILQRAALRASPGGCQDINDWAIYGTGTKALECARLLAGVGCRIRGFVDRLPRSIAGYEVVPVADCADRLGRDCPVLIAVHNPAVDVADIRARLRSVGMSNVWMLQEVIDVWPQLSRFWLGPTGPTLAAANKIVEALMLLSDASSRELFLALIDQRLNAAIDGLPTPAVKQQYFPDDLPPLPAPLRFVDCGAFTGDTIVSVRGRVGSIQRIAAFEPDPLNFRLLAEVVADDDAYLFPCGLWNETTQLRFSADGASGRIVGDGDTVVQAVALDQAIPNFAPNFIKMDIEGAEPNALAGGRVLISRWRPRLAISVYHQPDHLWSLLLQVAQWSLDYDFFLRSHAFNGFDTVLYALPRT